MKKALSLVLTMCIVLSLFATFVVSASAEEAVNLAAGKTYTYTPTDSHYYHSNEDWACSKTATTALTDGVVGGDYYGAASMVGWKNCDPTVTIDLGKVSTVSELKYNVFAGMDGIAEPTSVKVEVSVDGNTWTEVTCTSAAGSHIASTLDWVNNEGGYAVDVTVTPEAAVDAQYVKLSFTRTGTFVFLSEIEVWGTEKKVEVEWKPFFLSHFDDFSAEGACVIFTEAYEGCAWWLHVAFAPIAGEENAYEVVQVLDGRGDGKATPIAIPEGGFVYAMNTGNNWGDLVEECTANGTLESQWWYAQYQADPTYYTTNFINDATNAMLADASTWQVGDKLMFKNVDLEGKTVPTSTEGTNWYDDAYVCTAQYAAYVPGYSEDEGGKVVITKGENIALNKTYTISGCGERDTYHAKLTDGVAKAELSYNHDEWFGFYCNGADQTIINAPDKLGHVIIDLGESYDIYGVSINFMDLVGESGIYAPTAVNAYLSADGETWSDPVALNIPTDTTKGVSYAVAGEVSGSARYVKVDVALGGTFAFLNEIEVYEAVETIVPDDDESEVIVETITVDGDLNDTGWLEDGWTVVTKDNGTFQNGIDAMKNEASKSFSYKFQMRADETKLYVAAVYEGSIIEIDGSGLGTKFRLWINTNEEATVYTHFYDIYTKDGVIVAEGKYNTSTTENKGAMIGATETDKAYKGTLVGTMKEVDGKTYFEMSVDLAEFGGEDGFNYFFNAGFKTVDGENTDNIQMLYPAVTVPTDDKLANFPYRTWAADNDAVCDVAGIQLGERVVEDGEGGGETDDDLGDAGIYAIAALAVVALIGTAVVIKKRA